VGAHQTVDVAVGVATVGRPESLARCLDAIVDADVRPAELVVVDQGDDERTAEVVLGRTGEGMQIVHVEQAPLGLSASRNAAAARTRSSVLAMTDDDCLPGRGWVAAIHDSFEAGGGELAAVTGPMLPLPPLDEEQQFAVSSRTGDTPAEFSGTVPPWHVGTGGNFAIRREWLERIGPYDERLGAGTQGRAGEDMDLIHRVLAAGGLIRYDPRAVVYHERTSASHRRESRSAYGRGVGAYLAIRLRDRDPQSVRVAGSWLLLRGRLLGSALVRGQRAGVLEELMVLGGTIRGVSYGATAPRRSSSDS
jgi:GT2 family glycosyltransferase